MPKTPKVPSITATCTYCDVNKPLDAFKYYQCKHRNTPSRSSRCIECANIINNLRYHGLWRGPARGASVIVTDPDTQLKRCTKCSMEKPHSAFCINKKHTAPVKSWHYNSHCRQCLGSRFKNDGSVKALCVSLIHHKVRIERKRKNPREFNIDMWCLMKLVETQTKDGVFRCAATNVPLIIGSNKPLSASLDRIDCSLGYIVGNVRWVALSYNLARRNYTDDETKAAIIAIAASLSTII